MRERLLHRGLFGLQISRQFVFSASNPIRLGTIAPAAAGTSSSLSYLSFFFNLFVDCYVSFHTFPFFSSHNRNPNPESFVPNSSHQHRPSRQELQQLLLEKSKSGFDKFDDALELFDQMLQMRPRPSVIDFSRLLTAVAKMKHYSAVITLFTHMSACSVPVDIYMMITVINCLCHLNRVDYGFSVLALIIKRGFVPEVVTYTILMRGLLSENKFLEAEELLKNLFRIEPDVVMFGTIINGLCKTGNATMAIRMLQIMEEADCGSNNVAYTMIIDSLCKDKLVDYALDFFFIMIEKGIPPDVITYNSLIQGLCNLGRWEEAKLMLIEMNSMKIFPDLCTFNILLNACCKEGKVKDAELIVELMVQAGKNPDIVAYNALIDRCSLRGKKDGALAVLNTMINMINKGMLPDSISYTTLIHGYCKELKVNKAMQLFQQISVVGLQPTIEDYNTIIWGLLQAGKHVEAVNFFYEMEAQGQTADIVTFRTLVDGLWKNQCINGALTMLHLMEDNGFLPDISFYTIIIDRLCKNNMLNKARSFFDNLLSKGVQPDVQAYTIMIRGLCQGGLLKEAKEMLVEMESNGCLPNEVTYKTIIRGGFQY